MYPAQQLALELGAYVEASPSSYHAAAEAAVRLEAAGYTRLDEASAWELVPGGRYCTVREGAVAAFALPTGAPGAFKIFGAHTDSPAFKLKAGTGHSREGLKQVGVEIYGGPLLNSWLDRELLFAGRLALADGRTVLARTESLGRIPQLAIHLDRQVSEGLRLDKQQHTMPVIGTAASTGDVLEALAESAGVAAADIVAHDIVTMPAEAPALFGLERELLACPRLDNLSSAFTGLRAMESLRPEKLEHCAVFIANDHEEVGSATRTGAAGPFLSDVLERITAGLGLSREEHLRMLAGSVCLSADAGHAVHPNYPDRHDPEVRPVLGAGPLLKLNSQQRYASDALSTAHWAQTCMAAGVDYQLFVSNNAVPCGTTIGPITATRLGITCVDAGIPLLSMHSARELAAVADIAAFAQVAEAFLH